MSKELRSGYTTGTHATAVVVASVFEYFYGDILRSVDLELPSSLIATIEVQREQENSFSTIKVDNDDMDVTKGAKICATLYEQEDFQVKKQRPACVKVGALKLYLWAGEGVGVVTKAGLKIAPSYPAINPVPLAMIEQNLQNKLHKPLQGSLHIVISVENGEEIAKNTANAKVGVLGGISILGTRGIVKPVSATAYIESIATEISVASKNSEVVVFTLGNSAQDRALELYESVSVVEIGNFVYDALMLLEGYHFSKVVFITSVAKMTKVAQGYKNTHNRFGSIDFTQVKEMVESLGSSMQDDVVTLKAVLESLDASTQRVFIEQITQKAMMQIVEWIESKAEVTETLEVLTLPSEIKKEYRW